MSFFRRGRVDRGSFERFTLRARFALVLAQATAVQSRKTEIDPASLLLGVLHQTDSMGHGLVSDCRVDIEELMADLGAVSLAPTQAVEGVRLSEAAKEMIERMVREAQKLGHGHIGTEHFVLSALGNNSAVAPILESKGMTLANSRTSLTDLLSRGSASASRVGDDSKAVDSTLFEFIGTQSQAIAQLSSEIDDLRFALTQARQRICELEGTGGD